MTMDSSFLKACLSPLSCFAGLVWHGDNDRLEREKKDKREIQLFAWGKRFLKYRPQTVVLFTKEKKNPKYYPPKIQKLEWDN